MNQKRKLIDALQQMDLSMINSQTIQSGNDLEGVIIWWSKKSNKVDSKDLVPVSTSSQNKQLLLIDHPSSTTNQSKQVLALSTAIETKPITKFPAILTATELSKIEQTKINGPSFEISSPFFICVPQVVKGPKDTKKQYTLSSGKRVTNVREIATHFENLFPGVKIVVMYCNSDFTAVGKTGAKSKRTMATYHSKPISFNIAILPDCCADEPLLPKNSYNFQASYITTTVLGLSQIIQKLKINYSDSLQNLFPRPDSKR